MIKLKLIDAGLEEIEEQDGKVYVYGDYTAFGTLSKVLEDLKIEVESATLKRYPTSLVEFTEAQLEDIEKMLDKIEEDVDVQQVFTNIL